MKLCRQCLTSTAEKLLYGLPHLSHNIIQMWRSLNHSHKEPNFNVSPRTVLHSAMNEKADQQIGHICICRLNGFHPKSASFSFNKSRAVLNAKRNGSVVYTACKCCSTVAFCPFQGHRLSRSAIKWQIQPLCNNSSALIVGGLKCASFVSHSMLWPFVCGLFYTSTGSTELRWLVSQRQLLFVLAPITPISQSLMNHTHQGRRNGVMSSVITPITGIRSLQIPPCVCCVCG